MGALWDGGTSEVENMPALLQPASVAPCHFPRCLPCPDALSSRSLCSLASLSLPLRVSGASFLSISPSTSPITLCLLFSSFRLTG